MAKLGWPTIFCNTLEVADNGEIVGFKMRVEKSKYSTVKALQSVGFDTIAATIAELLGVNYKCQGQSLAKYIKTEGSV